MTHTITEDDVAEYVEQKRQEWIRLAGSYGVGSDKRLEFQIGHVAPLYRVKHFGNDIYIGAVKETAVREYNELP